MPIHHGKMKTEQENDIESENYIPAINISASLPRFKDS